MRRLSLALAAVVLGAACSQTAAAPPKAPAFPRGGTLRVATSMTSGANDQTMLDPDLDGGPGTIEVFRCCLLRTLLSYEGKPTEQGGTVLKPDLAQSLPAVSPDGLTWTFHLRAGVHYSPPFQKDVVQAADFIRTFQRVARIGTQPGAGENGTTYESVIVGFDDYVNGKAGSITGIEAPDPRTLIFHLLQPTGDFPYRMALPHLAPLPPSPRDAAAPLGAADGHDDGYGGYLVSTGPYMLQGIDTVDFNQAPQQQKTAAGWTSGQSYTLVRNPSWSPAHDSLRPAYPDRIVVTYYGPPASAQAPFDAYYGVSNQAVQQGQADVEFTGGAIDRLPSSVIAADRDRIQIDPTTSVRYASLNLAMPPLDDIHVRKAINLVLDKIGIRDASGAGQFTEALINHIGPDALEENALTGYQPYPSPGDHGDVSAAKREMAQSKYDANHDGICDQPACRGVSAIVRSGYAAAGDVIKTDLAEIGIQLNVATPEEGDFFREALDPTSRIAVTLLLGWQADYPNGSNFFVPLFRGNSINGSFDAIIGPPTANTNLLGASSADLQRWGYPVTTVPSVDTRIEQCVAVPGWQQTPCWVRLDEYLMEKVVPWVPLESDVKTFLLSAQIAHYSYDVSVTEPALDQIALKR